MAHGISSYIDGKKVVIGSSHFVFEDEGCTVRPECRERFEALPEEYSHLYLAIEKELVAVICIEDPLREEAADMIRALRAEGVQKTVMMTGDSEKTAAAVARGSAWTSITRRCCRKKRQDLWSGRKRWDTRSS